MIEPELEDDGFGTFMNTVIHPMVKNIKDNYPQNNKDPLIEQDDTEDDNDDILMDISDETLRELFLISSRLNNNRKK